MNDYSKIKALYSRLFVGDEDRDGNKIYDPKKRQYKCKSIPATNWNEQAKAEECSSAWASLCNQCLEQNGHAERIDHRSYERQGIDQIPTVHLGVAASAMEKRDDLNREIEVTNQKLLFVLVEKMERLSTLNALLNMNEKGDDALGMDDAPEEENEGQETSGHDQAVDKVLCLKSIYCMYFDSK